MIGRVSQQSVPKLERRIRDFSRLYQDLRFCQGPHRSRELAIVDLQEFSEVPVIETTAKDRGAKRNRSTRAEVVENSHQRVAQRDWNVVGIRILVGYSSYE